MGDNSTASRVENAKVENSKIMKARRILNAHFEMRIKLGQNEKVNRSYVLPSQDGEKKSGRLARLSANGDNSWIPTMGILSQEALFFSPIDKLQLSDCIPVDEIADIRAFDDTNDNLHLATSESGPAWSKKFNNLERLTSSIGFSHYPFVVYTLESGYNCNRTYFLRTDSDEERTAWIEAIADRVLVSYNASLTNRSKFRRIRNLGRQLYRHHITQKLTSLFIFGNFLQYCADAQLQPADGSRARQLFQFFEIFFTSVFAFELTANLFLHWFWCVTATAYPLGSFDCCSIFVFLACIRILNAHLP